MSNARLSARIATFHNRSGIAVSNGRVKQVFSKDGGLGRAIEGFQPRDEQVQMALAIDNAIENHQQLVVEAPTGTGKTFAYLVPALLAKKKTIISTGSKNLQDQLFNRDLPTIADALHFSGTTALLKGRANYLCLERLDYAIAQGVLGNKEVLADLKKIRHWNARTQTGDFAECTSIAEDSPIFSQLVSSTESCLGTDCPKYEECYVMKARKKAAQADVVVVNHHLFFADMAVKENGFGEIIPAAEIVIFDEAHQVPDIAAQYFGETLTSRQLFEFCRDLVLIYRTELKDMKQLEAVSDSIHKAVQDFRLTLTNESLRGNWRDVIAQEAVQQTISVLQEKLTFALEVIEPARKRAQSLSNIFDRVKAFSELLDRLCATEVTGYCYWFETFGRHFSLNITPLSVAGRFSRQMEKQEAAWIFTSATLEVAGKFDYFCHRMGIRSGEQLRLESPFDYPNQAILCVPRYLPQANTANTLTELAKRLLPVIEANKGRCFVLCTSYFMMRGFAEYFREHSDLNVLLQGETTKTQLLDKFVNEEKSVLVATTSFWEGIDVRGEALSLVIIDKLPFTAPDEPLLQARLEDCRLQGGNPFNQIQIPEAVITLKQGVGRLIRDVNDKGVVIICDSRLVMQRYAPTFLQSLPNAKRTRSLRNVVQFLTSLQNKK